MKSTHVRHQFAGVVAPARWLTVLGHLVAGEAIEGAAAAILIEDYPEYGRGPWTLVLQRDRSGRPIHAVWGIPRGQAAPAVLVTAYRPDPARWSDDFLRRRS